MGTTKLIVNERDMNMLFRAVIILRIVGCSLGKAFTIPGNLRGEVFFAAVTLKVFCIYHLYMVRPLYMSTSTRTVSL